MKTQTVSLHLLVVILFLGLGNLNYLFANDNVITVYAEKDIGLINKGVFGNNFVGYDPVPCKFSSNEYYGYSDYGAGLWNPRSGKSVNEVIALATEAGITILRFPGGCGTHHYSWKDAIGDKREHFRYGIDEFLKTCNELQCGAIITISYFNGDERDAADFVEYLNSEYKGDLVNESKFEGQKVEDGKKKVRNWAIERAKNGYPEPHHVKFFEIGNEIYHGNHKDINYVVPEEYAERYLKYYYAMKAVDPSIKIGVVLHTSDWNRKVLGIIRDKVDFGIYHTYPSPQISKDQLAGMNAKDIFEITLAMPIVKDQYIFKELLKLLEDNSDRTIPIAITEYNGGFVQEKPVPYRHCLGTALLNAELLRIFMRPEHNILMANYWQFVNEYWGMVANNFNGDYLSLNKPYYKRPNFFVHNLYKRCFGDVLLEVDVKGDWYDLSKYEFYETLIQKMKTGNSIKNNLLNTKWEIKEFQGVVASENSGVLAIEFADPIKFNYFHSFKQAHVKPDTFYKISGYIKTKNLIAPQGVSIEVQDGRGWVLTRSAADTTTVNGTNNWQYVDVIYKTLPDAKSVKVIARRVGTKGPLKGKAFFKDLSLEEFIPSLNKHIPYISVNASKSLDGRKLYLMVLNKHIDQPITSTIHLKGFLQSPQGNAWILNGPTIDATNEKDSNNVKVKYITFESKRLGSGTETSFTFTFEPHSLTALEIEQEVSG